MKKSLLLILMLLLGGTVYAQENELQLFFESPQNTRPAGFTEYIDVSGLTDANGDGVADLILTRRDDRGNLTEILAIEADRAGAQGQQAHDRLHRRRLAGAVAAEQAEDLARLRLQRQAEEDLDAVIGDVDAGDFKHRRAT